MRPLLLAIEVAFSHFGQKINGLLVPKRGGRLDAGQSPLRPPVRAAWKTGDLLGEVKSSQNVAGKLPAMQTLESVADVACLSEPSLRLTSLVMIELVVAGLLINAPTEGFGPPAAGCSNIADFAKRAKHLYRKTLRRLDCGQPLSSAWRLAAAGDCRLMVSHRDRKSTREYGDSATQHKVWPHDH